MRFVGFLNQHASWHAQYRDTHVKPDTVRALLSRLDSSNLPHLDPDKLQIFCAYNPIEALLCYFIASHFGLTAAVVSPRGLSKLLDGLESKATGSLVIPVGHRPPRSHWTGSVINIDLGLDDLANIDQTDQQAPLIHAPQSARFIFCTSGTTGKAKRVVHDERILANNAKIVSDYLGLVPSDRSYCVFPLQFMFGLSTTLCSLWSNSHITYGEFVMPTLVGDFVQQSGTTVLPLLGEWSLELSQTWRKLAYQPERLILINASDRLLQSQAQELLPWASAFWNNLGQTESAPRLFAIELVNQQPLDQLCFKGTIAVGQVVHPDIQVKLEDLTGDVGSLFYKTPFAMLGYMTDDGSITPAPEWIDSGDLFYIDHEQTCYWVGRKSHTIKVNGELVPLSIVTNLLLTEEHIKGVGYTTNKKGELCAFIETELHCDIYRNKLQSILADKLRGKRSQVQFVNKLPRTENGKLDFSQLRLQATSKVQTTKKRVA